MSGKFYCRCSEAKAIYEMQNKDQLASHRKGSFDVEFYCMKCDRYVKYKTSLRTHFVMWGMLVAVAYGFIGMFYGGVMIIKEPNIINVTLMVTGMACLTIPKLIGETFEKQVNEWEERGVKII